MADHARGVAGDQRAQSAAGASVLVAVAAPTTVVVAVARLVLHAAAGGRPELLGRLYISYHLLDDVGDQEPVRGRLARLASTSRSAAAVASWGRLALRARWRPI